MKDCSLIFSQVLEALNIYPEKQGKNPSSKSTISESPSEWANTSQEKSRANDSIP